MGKGERGLANCGDKPSLEVSCPFINFFCSAQHAEAWARPDGWVGQFLPLHQAVALAVDRFHFIIELYQRCAPTLRASGDNRTFVC
ncbi:MAG: organomercurial lyase [bacterium]